MPTPWLAQQHGNLNKKTMKHQGHSEDGHRQLRLSKVCKSRPIHRDKEAKGHKSCRHATQHPSVAFTRGRAATYGAAVHWHHKKIFHQLRALRHRGGLIFRVGAGKATRWPLRYTAALKWSGTVSCMVGLFR